ncbi:MAG TPA: glycogen debranching N-terminal domain-containing protein [Pseudonocardia sp.]|uniref:glycogen debranching N-terminal domain-containing protein n=1 Tax=Pseudonocardia sp. TaxID=60912 RepID=UPI002B4B41AD|nr:glycogen debranching N-terminal domain-containing protein [Pseudonocardia sp.]HLU56380.1 glycogen debranching N-terminal domain-containing protein [Pseudonocardia sp.]
MTATRPATDRPGETTLDHLLTVLAAPAELLSDPDGQVRPEGAQGFYVGDTRYCNRLEVGVEGVDLRFAPAGLDGAGRARFEGELRGVRLRRERRVAERTAFEEITLHNPGAGPVDLGLVVHARSDLSATPVVKSGVPLTDVPPTVQGGEVRWARREVSASLTADPAPGVIEVDGTDAVLRWPLRLAPGERWSVRVVLAPSPAGPEHFRPAAPLPWRLDDRATGGRRGDLLRRSLADLEGLLLADPVATADRFAAAGSPWFCTLFGRDSLWTARMMLPMSTELAGGTLRVLARRQGRVTNPRGEEEPGKIIHEFRPNGLKAGGLDLPPSYYGTVDATPLWCCLLHDAWRAGLPEAEVAELIPHLEAALGWLKRTAGDYGFLSYRRVSGSGLANQGWKDSVGAVRWADGTVAAQPLALCEVQGYAYAAARGGAELLAAFDRPGADEWRQWADRLAALFRATYWIDDPDGRYPAIALDGHGRAVTGPASNMAHLLTTGILDDKEAQLVADRLARPDLDCGRGLRTLANTNGGYDPLTYHRGSVWPHDTAIAVLGLAGIGRHEVARSLAEGLVAAAGEFDDRLPELYAEVDGEVVSYPTACRPQAWAAAGAVAVVSYLETGVVPAWATPR